MGPEIDKGEILSTWKEIAAYLNSGTRTCLRWEKTAGLPVHRQEGAPRSRIYAYKHELDAWFKSRLSNGTLHEEEGGAARPFWKKPYIVVPAVVILAAAAYWLFFRAPVKPMPAGGMKVGSRPMSSGPAEISAGSILEAESAPAGRIRIWRAKDDIIYHETWRIEPVRHTSCAAGDLDGDPYIEAAAPGHCRDFAVAGDYTTSKIRFFINAYKRGYTDWWKTTYYEPSQCVIEKDNFEFTETAIGDVDGVPGNEIALATAHSLSVFRYEPKLDEIRLICTQKAFLENVNVLMRSIAITDIDGDGRNEVLAAANEGEEGAQAPGKGWIFVFRWTNGRPEVSRVVELPGSTSVRALKVGDVIPGGTKEAVVACYRVEKGLRNAYVLGWTYDRGFVFEKFIDEVGEGQYGGIYPAVGDLAATPGDEILVGRNNPNGLISLFWKGSGLVAGPTYGIDANARISNVQIGAPRRKGIHSSILVSGASVAEDQGGRFYLQLAGFGDGFVPDWVRLGGEKGDLAVTYATFVEGEFYDPLEPPKSKAK